MWRADRPQEGRFREFVQCDIDTVGSHSPLADAEVVLALAQCLDALGVREFTVMVNSRKALYALLDVYGIAPDNGPGVLGTLDKLDKISADAVAKELASERGISPDVAESLVADVAADSPNRVRERLEATEQGKAGLAEIDTLIRLTTSAGLARERIVWCAVSTTTRARSTRWWPPDSPVRSPPAADTTISWRRWAAPMFPPAVVPSASNASWRSRARSSPNHGASMSP
ncbi:hypothetical protein GCM10023347_23330 [Streptomyces chumphonensis]